MMKLLIMLCVLSVAGGVTVKAANYNLENLALLKMGKSIINAKRSIYKTNMKNKKNKAAKIAKINEKIGRKATQMGKQLMKQAVKHDQEIALLSTILDAHQAEIDAIRLLLDENDFDGAAELYAALKKAVKEEFKAAQKEQEEILEAIEV